ncbi:hypothetical protein J2B92_19525 [Lysinibacillus sphaericus]|uniref:hypothetical protein n=1 Tax=Lysinibacillus sphaericus TaxID=1421 RepID=UPI0018CEA408|nr:hypothetical protein [Lysinibacillus sphaericus]QTB12958.1 hypothetical protein J2B92_19525 [Lysinibacillus sphaericus]
MQLCKVCKQRTEMYYSDLCVSCRTEVYLAEFKRVTALKGKYLTKKGFDEESSISSIAIILTLKRNWEQLLHEHNLIEVLYEYATDEYEKLAYMNGKASSTQFTREHPYLGQYVFSSILDIKKIRRKLGFINENYTGMYNETLLKWNFDNVKSIIGRIPTIGEFNKESKILASIYCDYYGINGQQWDKVLQIMVKDEKELGSFLAKRDNLYKEKSIEALMAGRIPPIPDEDLEREFRRVFDMYIDKYGTHPTKRIFNEESIYNDNTYRKRYGMSWRNIAFIKYGYELKVRNVNEKIFLESVKQVLKSDFESQKTFKWLLGIKGAHLFCDGYFEKFNLIVEFDGKHHRVPVANFGGTERFLKDQENDKLKEQLVKAHDINFLRVSSKERWRDMDYLKLKLERVLDMKL